MVSHDHPASRRYPLPTDIDRQVVSQLQAMGGPPGAKPLQRDSRGQHAGQQRRSLRSCASQSDQSAHVMTACPIPHITADMQISGTLARDADLRFRPLDSSGHNVPVICFDLVANGAVHMPVRVEWPQPADGYQAAERLLKTLKRGTTVTVQAPLLGMRLLAANASQVHASAQTAHTPSSATPELF